MSRGELWSDEMVQRLYTLTREGVSATGAAVTLGKEFGFLLTRNAVLGRLHRDRVAGKDVPVSAATRGGSTPKPAVPKPAMRKNSWRIDDEKWLRALVMRRRGHKWDFVAAHMRLPVSELKGRLRSIALDDIAEGGAVQDWSYVLEPVPVDD